MSTIRTLCFLILLLGSANMVNAQKTKNKKKSEPATPPQSISALTNGPKTFGGSKQYRTWSVGVNVGALAPAVITGGPRDFTNWDTNLGYGVSVRKQLAHSFSLELNGMRGTVSGTNVGAPNGIQYNRKDFETNLAYAFDIRGVVNVATVDFLRRENAVNFIASVGYGTSAYATKYTDGNDQIIDLKGSYGSAKNKKYTHSNYIPVGVGVKFKVSDRVSLNANYLMSFVDANDLDATQGSLNIRDKFSYTSVGVEYSLGAKAKPNLDWVNPLAIMYDELKDETIKKELKALKERVVNLENAVENLKKDSDGDGVSDEFDKCPNTDSKTTVDGAGCPLSKTTDGTGNSGSNLSNWETVGFEFQSAVLKTESYPALEKLALDLKQNNKKLILKGHASDEGTDAYNLKLSKDRAESVKTFLVNSGINADRITTQGFGSSIPIASNDTEEGRSKNRRVEPTVE